MQLLQQAVELLSQAPGNIVYHLVTLLTLQVVFALSRSHWQREPGDSLARRMAWSSGAIFLARLTLLLIGIFGDDSTGAAVILPPLQHAADTLTAALIVWALIPHSKRFPRLANVALIIVLIGIAVAAAIYVDSWRPLADRGEAYLRSDQAKVWSVAQVSLLGIGLLLILSTSKYRATLNPAVVGILLVAHIANLTNTPRLLVDQSDIAYWVRLGHLMAFPLWAALAYRYSLAPLLAARRAQPPSAELLSQFLHHSTKVITSTDREEVLNCTVDMIGNTLDAVFVGIALSDGEDPSQVRVVSNQPQIDLDQPRQWELDLSDWPPFRLAIEQRQTVHLVPDGLGARQLFSWYEVMGIAPLGALLIQPPEEESVVCMLILAGPEGKLRWLEHERALAAELANYVAQVIDAAFTADEAARSAISTGPLVESDKAVSGRIVALEGERKRLQSELETTRSRLIRAEEQAVVSGKRARDLAATVQELEGLRRGERIDELEQEIESLRESLIEAEEAMALAAAGEGGLSTEWVMLTITRYSGQLEEAQARIQSLEAELEHWEKGPTNQVVASLAQELRTPMTSIAGYTDLLLSKQTGTLGSRQSDFVRRIKANVERMGSLLEQIVQMTKVTEQLDEPVVEDEWVNVQDVIEAAISAVITQIRDKKLRLDMDIAGDLPELDVDASALSRILTSLLGNACQSTQNNGRVAVTARAYSLPNSGQNGQFNKIDYVKLSVSDGGGGISPDDWSRVFDPQHRADNPLIAGLGDTGAALAVARTLTEDNGGRIWLDSEPGVGSTFSTLFPVAAHITERTAESLPSPNE